MKIHQLNTLLAVLAALMLAVACGEESTDTSATTTPSTESAPDEGDDEGEAQAGGEAAGNEAQGEGAGGSVCERAVSCCEAYVAAAAANTPGLSAETACAGVRQAGAAPGGDATCTAAIGGWRTSLQALNQTVPASCAE